MSATQPEGQRIDAVLEQMEKFRVIYGDEEEHESVDNIERNFLLNFQDKLGRTAMHYACFYGSIGVVEDLTFLKASPWIEDAYLKRPIDLIQEGPKYDVLIELLTNNMKVVKNPSKKVNNANKVNESQIKSKGTKKKHLLRSLDIKDLKLIPNHKLLSERIGIAFDNYLSFAIRNKNYEATKYLLSLNIFDIDFKNASGFTYFHLCVADQSLELLKLLFLDPAILQEPYDSKDETNSEDYYDNLNKEIFLRKIFEVTSNKNNNLLNC